jgi:hypothetical protein
MKLSTKDELKGTLHELKGKVKEQTGQVSAILSWQPQTWSKLSQERKVRW